VITRIVELTREASIWRMFSRKPSEERRRMKDAEKTRKLEEEKRKEKERERQEHEKGNNYKL